jgi:hypothetical protein
MISDIDLAEEDAMRIAGLTIVAFVAAVTALPAVATPLCRPALFATFGPAFDTFATTPPGASKLAARCPSPGRRPGTLPVCRTGPSITCRGSCSGGAEWITWTCCIDPDGFQPACLLDCRRQLAECLAQ